MWFFWSLGNALAESIKDVFGKHGAQKFDEYLAAFSQRFFALFFFRAVFFIPVLVSPVVVGLNWRRGTKAGALAAMLAGTAVVVAWSLPEAKPFGLDPIVAGVGTSILAFVAVSYASVGAGFSRPDGYT